MGYEFDVPLFVFRNRLYLRMRRGVPIVSCIIYFWDVDQTIMESGYLPVTYNYLEIPPLLFLFGYVGELAVLIMM